MGKTIRAMGPGPLELFPFVVLAILMAMVFICVKDISGTTLPRNFVHMTSMTSCIVGKTIRAMGPGPLELFPFVVLAILMAMAGAISEHMLTSWSSLFSMTRVKDAWSKSVCFLYCHQDFTVSHSFI